MRDRLIELLGKELMDYASWQTEMALAGNYDMPSVEEVIADKILKDGWFRPPCKVGDKVYFVFEGDVLSDEITLIEVTESAMYLSTCSERYMLIDGYLYSEMLDEKAYFTKEEAEQALRGDKK